MVRTEYQEECEVAACYLLEYDNYGLALSNEY